MSRPAPIIDDALEDQRQQPGRVMAVRGSVVEVAFPDGLPAITEALRVPREDRGVILEVAHHLDHRTVRAIAMAPRRGWPAA